MRLSEIFVETAAWQKKSGKNKNGGLNRKGVMSYRRQHPGSKLQTAVTTKPSKLKPGSKAAKRRKSFCARMGGMKGPMKKPNGKPTRKALALRKWNCHESVMEAANAAQQAAIAIAKKKEAGVDEAGIMGFMSPKPMTRKPSTPLSVMRKEFEKDTLAPAGQAVRNKNADERKAQVHRRTADEAVAEAYQNDESNLMYKYDTASGRVRQRMVDNHEERSAHQAGYRGSVEDALKAHKIIRSKFNPKKWAQRQGNQWVEVFPFGKPNLSELDKNTLANYVKANANDQVQHASSQGFMSGQAGDKYNKADAWDHRTTKREKGMDRALNRLRREDANGQIGISNNDSTSPIHGFEENLDEVIESRLYSMKRAGYDIL
jgi:hypothetical protein